MGAGVLSGDLCVVVTHGGGGGGVMRFAMRRVDCGVW